MNIKQKQGSVIVEAAIFLPVFIIAILMIGYIIRVVQVQETTMSVMTGEARKVMVQQFAESELEGMAENAGISELFDTALLSGTAYGISCKKQLDKELGKWVKEVRLREFSAGKEDECSMTVSCGLNFPVTNLFGTETVIQEHILCRAFVGDSRTIGNSMSFLLMEQDGDGIVYIFPKTGEKYHGESCPLVKAEAKWKLLTSQLRKQKQPCKLCGSRTLENGTPVFCFSNVYHKKSCRIVQRCMVPVMREEAEAKDTAAA